MNYQITNRLHDMLESDKIGNPQRVCKVLEEELSPIIESYIQLEKDVKVRFKKEKNKNIFFIEFEAQRINSFGYQP
ncbi:MAG: hypothetical protein J6A28_01385 [Clostridia bacterium]|nr:hypothetical protein [Clostridia bacterium]